MAVRFLFFIPRDNLAAAGEEVAESVVVLLKLMVFWCKFLSSHPFICASAITTCFFFNLWFQFEGKKVEHFVSVETTETVSED